MTTPLRFLIFLMCACPLSLLADSITVTGAISQSQDPTTPATNNQSLNQIAIGDPFSLTLGFNGAITTPGSFTGTSLVFNDAKAGASESSFSSESLTISQSGGFDLFSLQGCLTTGTACDQGNQLDLIFQIAMTAGIQAPGTSAQDQPLLSPSLKLLEDDGLTNIFGEVSNYSYTGPTAPVPEPGTLALLCTGLGGLWLRRRRK